MYGGVELAPYVTILPILRHGVLGSGFCLCRPMSVMYFFYVFSPMPSGTVFDHVVSV